MDVKEAIEKRRSVRKFKDKEVSENIVEALLDAVRRAPSARNTQGHKYFVVKDKKTKELLKENDVFKQPYVYDAPLIFVCCSDPNSYKNPEVDYPLIDLSIDAGFIVLRATELGLGAVIVATIEREKIKEVLKIPEEFILPFIIVLGYPAEEPVQKPKKELNEIVF